VYVPEKVPANSHADPTAEIVISIERQSLDGVSAPLPPVTRVATAVVPSALGHRIPQKTGGGESEKGMVAPGTNLSAGTLATQQSMLPTGTEGETEAEANANNNDDGSGPESWMEALTAESCALPACPVNVPLYLPRWNPAKGVGLRSS
jgi:hypothetical protein